MKQRLIVRFTQQIVISEGSMAFDGLADTRLRCNNGAGMSIAKGSPVVNSQKIGIERKKRVVDKRKLAKC